MYSLETSIRYTLKFENTRAKNVFILTSTEGKVPGATGLKRGEKVVEIRFVPKYYLLKLISLRFVIFIFCYIVKFVVTAKF